jgi:hypothetical protein
MNVNPIAWAASTLRLFTRIDNDGVNRTVPVTEIKEVPIGFPDMDIALLAKGTGATLAQAPDGTIAGGNKRGPGATDWQKERHIPGAIASGNYSTIGGGGLNTASGQYGTVAGGYGGVASGIYGAVGGGQSNSAASTSVVAGGGSNTASGSSAAICGGQINNATSSLTFIGGGSSNTASTGTHAVVCGGNTNTASALNATICGGRENLANSAYSFISGGYYGTTRSIQGNHVFPAIVDAISTGSYYGKTQAALLLVARETTDATATVLTSNSSAAATSNQVTLPNNSAYSFSGEVIAGVTGAGDSARWTIDGAIKRGANAASTVMIGTPTVVMSHFDAGAAAWVVAVTANTTLGCITVTVTGAAATTIRWVCRIDTTEMSF